jgi:hypothetical protein
MREDEVEFASAIIRHMFNAQTHKFIARMVLVWFALFVGAAIAAPIVHPTDTQMICTSAGGMKMVSMGEEGAEPKVATNMDCPLCAAVVIPVQLTSLSFEKPSALAHSLQPLATAHIASATAPPLPSRGPPNFS